MSYNIKICNYDSDIICSLDGLRFSVWYNALYIYDALRDCEDGWAISIVTVQHMEAQGNYRHYTVTFGCGLRIPNILVDSTILTVNQQNNNSVDFRYYWVYALYHKSCVKNKKWRAEIWMQISLEQCVIFLKNTASHAV